MGKRKVHLRPNTVIELGRTRTRCNMFYIWKPATDSAAAVGDYGCFDATTHGALVTCLACLRKMGSGIATTTAQQEGAV